MAAEHEAFGSLAPQDRAVLHAAHDGVLLVAEPFAELGRRAGLSDEAALDRLRALAGAGVIDGITLVLRGGGPQVPADAIEQGLLDALACGLPLVSRPFEALGALLGVSAEAVLARLLAWQLRGELQCLAPTHQGVLFEA